MNALASDHAQDPAPLNEAKPSPVELWQRYHAAGPGDSSEEELIQKYIPLVKTVVGRVALTLPPRVQQDDLYSAGLVGLLNAVRQFNPSLGTAFEPYARLRIRGAVLDELRRMDWVPRSVHAKARKIQDVMSELERKTGSIPSDAEVAEALKIPLSEYEHWIEEVRPATFICLDAPLSTDGENETTEHDTLALGPQESPFEKTSRAELLELIEERIRQLPDMQKKVLALYYYEGLRLREIAEAFGFCESHICQTHAKAVLAIRAFLAEHEAGLQGKATMHRRSGVAVPAALTGVSPAKINSGETPVRAGGTPSPLRSH